MCNPKAKLCLCARLGFLPFAVVAWMLDVGIWGDCIVCSAVIDGLIHGISAAAVGT